MGLYLNKKEAERYEKWRRLDAVGLLLTPDKLLKICDMYYCNPALIGKAILDAVTRILEREKRI